MAGDQYLTLAGQRYRLDLANYVKRDAQDFAPVVRDGHPSGGTLADESEVGWNTWHGGAFLATYRQDQGDRYATSTDVWAVLPGQIICGPQKQTSTGIAAAITALKTVDASGRIVALTATDVFYRDSGANSFTSVLTATPTDVIEFDGNYYAAQGNSAVYQYKNALSATGWTTSTLGATGNKDKANLWAADMAGSGAAAGRLWKTVSPNNVYSAADPTNSGNWSSAYLVGSSKFSINALRVFDDRLIVGKPEGIFWLKPDGTAQMLFSFRDAIHTSNASFLVQAHTGVFLAPWLHGLVAFRPGATAANVTVEDVWRQFAPSVRSSDDAAKGRFVAAVAGPTATYFVLYDVIGGNYYLVVWTGEDVDRGWHVVYSFGGTDASVIGYEPPASTTNNQRLYTKNASASPTFFVLPRDTDELRNDTNVTFETSGQLEMSEYESPLPEIRKTFVSLDIRAENLSAGSRSVLVEYSGDGSAWTTLGTATVSGSTSMSFAAGETYRRLAVRLTLTGTASASPRVRAVYLRYILNPTSRKEWLLRLSTAPGSGDDRTALQDAQDMDDLRATFAGQTLVDIDEQSFTVLVKSVGVQVEEVKLGSGNLVWWVQTRLLQSFGAVATIGAGSYGALEKAGDYSALETYTYGQLETLAV